MNKKSIVKGLAMKSLKYIRVFLLLLLLASPAWSQTATWQATNGPYGGPADKIVVAGVDSFIALTSSDIFFTADRGASWNSIKSNLPSNMFITCAAVNSLNQFFVGGYTLDNTAQLYRSGDLGQSWFLVNNGLSVTNVYDIIVVQDDTLVIGTGDNIYRSGDNGINWTVALGVTGLPVTNVQTLHTAPTGTVFAADFGSLYYSINRGQTWNTLATGGSSVSSIAVNSSGGIFTGSYDGIRYAPDLGGNFSLLTNDLPTNIDINTLVINNTGTVFAGTRGMGIYRSVNTGANWTPINRDLSTLDVSSLNVDNANTLIAGTKNHVFISTDNGDNWNRRSSGYLNTRITAMLDHGNEFLAGTELGMYRTNDLGQSWISIPFFDSLQVKTLLANKDGDLFAGTNFHGIYRSTDGGASWDSVNTGLQGRQVSSMAISENGLLFMSNFNGVFQSTNNGGNWNNIYASGYESPAMLSVSDDTLYVANYDGIYRLTFNGTTWDGVLINSNLFSVNRLAMRNDGLFYAGSFNGLFRSANNGVDWTDITGWTGNHDVGAIQISRQGHIFAGTDSGGVYLSTDAGDTWESWNSGIPNTSVSAMALNITGDLLAGSTGKGIFATTIDNFIFTVDPTGPIDFGTVNANTTVTDSVQITNYGYLDANLTAFNFSGDAGFSTPDSPFSIVPGSADYVHIEFSPLTAGTYNGSLEIVTNSDTLRIALTGFAQEAILSVSPTQLTYPSTLINSTVLDSVLISNSGNANLVMNEVTLSGADASGYTIESALPLDVLGPSDNQWLRVSFNPDRTGLFSALLNISSNGGSIEVPLSGEGINAVLSVSTDSITYDTTLAGTASLDSVILTNTGNTGLNITQTQVSGTNSERFIVNNAPTTPIAANSSYTLLVTFLPDTAGDFTAQLNITSDGGDTFIELSGIGVMPEQQDLIVTPDSLHVGEAFITQSVSDSLLLYNPGQFPVQVTSMVISGEYAAEFSFDQSIPITINAGQDRYVVFTFTPATTGYHNAELTITTANGNILVPLTGIGWTQQPQAIFSPNTTNITFTSTAIGSSSQQILQVVNSGSIDLGLSDITIVTQNSAEFNVSGPDSIRSGQSVNYTFQFSPETVGNKTATAIFTSNAITSPDSIFLTGTAVNSLPQPAINLNPTQITFTETRVNNSRTTPLQIINEGEATLTISQVGKAGTDAVDFVIPAILAPIEPLGSLMLNVVFQPQSPGDKSAWLVLTSNAPTSPDSVLMTGTAVQQLVDISVNIENRPLRDTDYTFSITLDRDDITGTRRLYYRNTGQSTWQYTELERAGVMQFTGTIPASAMQLRGVEYYIQIGDGADISTYPTLDAATNPARLSVSVDSYQPPITLPAKSYRMVSFPCVINNMTLAGIFTDDYGAYDPTRWRLLQYYPGYEDSTTHYLEYSYFHDEFGVSPGMAFWLITSDGKLFDVDSASTMNSEYTYYLSPGWNMIGNPYAFNVSVSEIFPETVELPITYNNGSYTSPQTIIQPWNGYWVNNLSQSPVSITLPLLEAGSVGKSTVPWSNLAGNEMVVRVSATVKDGQYKDDFNYLGLLADADISRDRYDYSEPPPITKDIQVYVRQAGEQYSGNFKPANSDGAVWELVLSADTKQDIQLSWQMDSAADQDKQLYLFDMATGAPLRVDAGTYTLSGGMHGQRIIKAILGTKDFALQNSDGMPLVPVDYALQQNYPNPFNPETRITYQLAMNSQVKLDVYNVLGHHVRTLVDASLSTGNHSATWDGKDATGLQVAAGVYFYRLTAGSFQSVKKMVLVR